MNGNFMKQNKRKNIGRGILGASKKEVKKEIKKVKI